MKEKGFNVGVRVFVDSNVIWEITKLVGDQKVVELKQVNEAEVKQTSKASAKTKTQNPPHRSFVELQILHSTQA